MVARVNIRKGKTTGPDVSFRTIYPINGGGPTAWTFARPGEIAPEREFRFRHLVRVGACTRRARLLSVARFAADNRYDFTRPTIRLRNEHLDTERSTYGSERTRRSRKSRRP